MTSEEFDAYRHHAVHELMDRNEECERKYRISDWPHWDYDFDSGTLVFSAEGVHKVIASVQVVGTTSDHLKNWLWGWANPRLPAAIVEGIRQVKKFGETECIDKLTEGAWPDDEYLGWEMTAIACRILGGYGSYRCPSNDGFTYLVYTAIGNADEGVLAEERNKSGEVGCSTHGKGYPAYACEHLLSNPSQDWFSEAAKDSNRWPDAWCAGCDEIFQEQDEWNERNEGRLRIKLLCHRCYEALRKQSLPDQGDARHG